MGIDGVTLLGNLAFEKGQISGVDVLSMAATGISIAGDSSDANDEKSGIKNGSGAIIFKSDGVAGTLLGKAALQVTGISLGADIGFSVNTTNGDINTVLAVGDDEVTINVQKYTTTSKVRFELRNVDVNFGNLIEVYGDFSVGGGAFSATNLDVFVGNGKYKLESGEINDNAIGVVLSNGKIDYLKASSANGYALRGAGGLELVGLEGLSVSGMTTLLINTSKQKIDVGGVEVEAGTFSFKATNAALTSLTALLSVEPFNILRKANGDLDVIINGGEVAINDADGESIFNIKGKASFLISKKTGFQMQTFFVNGFSIMDQIGLEVPLNAIQQGFAPQADFILPSDVDGLFTASKLKDLTSIDIQYNDLNGEGMNISSITDSDPEFRVLVDGIESNLVTVDGNGVAIEGQHNTYEYKLNVDQSLPDDAIITVETIDGSFSDIEGNGNDTETEAITEVTGSLSSISSPLNGAVVSASSLNTRRYIDVTFETQDGTAINSASIIDDAAEFTFDGSGVGNVRVINDKPILIAGFDDGATSRTYRYNLEEVNGQLDDPLFVDGEVIVKFIKESLSPRVEN